MFHVPCLLLLESCNIYSPIHPVCHLSDLLYSIEIVEVLIVQIADYTDCGMEVVKNNYKRSILKNSNK